jgi:hypothetical protein
MVRSGEFGRTARDIKDALGIGKSMRTRQAEVVSLSKTANTATIKIAGATQVAGVKYFTCLPCPTYSVWCVTDGEDIYITDSMGPAPVIKWGRTSNINIGNSAEEPVQFEDPTGPSNNGFDYWAIWANTDASSRSRMNVPAPGIWRWDTQVAFANGTGRRYIELQRDTGALVGRDAVQTAVSTGTQTMTAFATTRHTDATGVWVRCSAFQNSGAALALDGSNDQNQLTATWRGLPTPAGS